MTNKKGRAFKFLTPAVARGVVEKIKTFALNLSELKRAHLHIVIYVPSENGIPELLFESSLGEKSEWEHDYEKIAQSKAHQIWQGRNDSGATSIMPHLLRPGDTPYYGAVKRKSIVVACSGVQPWFDQMISGMVAEMCIAYAHNAWETSTDKRGNVDFVT